MPTREIKESIRFSETLAQTSDFGERLFVRLMTYADDFGRFPGDAALVRAACFARMLDTVRENRVANGLMELARLDLIRFYQGDDGKPYGFFTTWSRHQRTRAKFSKYPAPSSADMCRQTPVDVVVLNRILPSSTDRNRVVPNESDSAAAAGGACLATAFEQFWIAYPKKKGRSDAERAWKKLAPDPELQRVMLAALAAHKASDDWTREGGRFIPYPATWLNGKRWTDEVRRAAPARESIADAWAGRQGGEVRI